MKYITNVKDFDVYPILNENEYIIITSLDYTNNTGTFKLLQTKEECDNFFHNWSLNQFPEWHKEHCIICKK